jgi:DtxR family Mn-dependent transcriptional regulator
MSPRRQGNVNTESVDNYLKAIVAFGGPDERRVSSTSLADRLGVAPASATNMLQKLAAASVPFVEYERHRGVLLSAAGKRRALEVLRHHRLLETFLFEVLDYPIEEVSERFEERIAAKLGHPQFDPHGHYIPAMNGQMPKQNSFALAEVREDGAYVIESLLDRDASLLKRLNANGIAPGVRLHVKRRGGDEFILCFGVRPKMLRLSRESAESVRLRPSR